MSITGKLKRAQEERRARLGIDEQGIEYVDHNGDPVNPEMTPYELALEEGLAVELAEAGLEVEPIVGDPDTSPFMLPAINCIACGVELGDPRVDEISAHFDVPGPVFENGELVEWLVPADAILCAPCWRTAEHEEAGDE